MPVSTSSRPGSSRDSTPGANGPTSISPRSPTISSSSASHASRLVPGRTRPASRSRAASGTDHVPPTYSTAVAVAWLWSAPTRRWRSASGGSRAASASSKARASRSARYRSRCVRSGARGEALHEHPGAGRDAMREAARPQPLEDAADLDEAVVLDRQRAVRRRRAADEVDDDPALLGHLEQDHRTAVEHEGVAALADDDLRGYEVAVLPEQPPGAALPVGLLVGGRGQDQVARRAAARRAGRAGAAGASSPRCASCRPLRAPTRSHRGARRRTDRPATQRHWPARRPCGRAGAPAAPPRCRAPGPRGSGARRRRARARSTRCPRPRARPAGTRRPATRPARGWTCRSESSARRCSTSSGTAAPTSGPAIRR